MSHLEENFLIAWNEKYQFIFPLEREIELIPGKKYRFDFVHRESRTAIEIHGGTFSKHKYGHATGTGLDRDYAKLNLAALYGYTVFQLSSKMITRQWIDLIARHVENQLKIKS